MGAGMGNPVDESTKREIEETIKAVLATFTIQYTKAAAIAMVVLAKRELKKKPKPFLLEKRGKEGQRKDPWKSGFLVKEGAVVKNWKKRFFVVRPDYSVDYYETEDESKKEKGKKKGSMTLCGYWVNEDPNANIITRLKSMAEKMGMNFDDLPKPKEYPPHTIELYHFKRRSYYIQCANEEEKKEWVDMFKTCCRYAYGLKNREFVHERAFHEAVRRTRWELGRWGWWSYGGSEEQILTDLIADQLEWAIMGRIYSRISGPWMVRQKIRDTVGKSIDTTVAAAVKPAWAAMEKAVEVLRPKIEPTIKEKTTDIVKLEDELQTKMKEGTLSLIEPILNENVKPHLAKIVEIIKSPVVEAFDTAIKIFEEQCDQLDLKGSNKDEIKRGFWYFDWLPWSYRLWPSFKPLDAMYDPLWALHVIFSDIYPWGLIYDAQHKVRGRIDAAVWTYQHRLLKEIDENSTLLSNPDALKQAQAKVKATIVEELKQDAKVATEMFYVKLIKKIIMPPFNKLVKPAVKAVLDPIGSLIPDPLKEIVDPNDTFNQFLNDIIDHSIKIVLSP